MATNNLPLSVNLTDQSAAAQRRIAADDYIGNGRTAAYVARRRFHLLPSRDEMQDLIQEAAANYWLSTQVQGNSPALAWNHAMYRTQRYYWRKLRGYSHKYPLADYKAPLYLQDPLTPTSNTTYLDNLANAVQDADADTRLDWLSHEDLVKTLIQGRRAAGVPERSISYSVTCGTPEQEATIIRLAAQGHTNASIALILDTTEGNIKHRRVQIRRWLSALAEQMGVADNVEPWDKSGGDHARAAHIQATYPGHAKP